MLRLTSSLRTLMSHSLLPINRHVVNVRNNNSWFDEDEMFLDMESEVMSRSDLARQERDKRKFVKRKILMKKNFPMPKEAPVLTWEAMEQMKFLNKEFPEEWTLDKITESFPVSRFTAIRILKSGRKIWTEEKIIRHNEKVQRNLEALQSGNVYNNEELINVLNSLTANNKMSLLSNSGGLKGVPMPTSEQSYADLPKEITFNEQLAQLRVSPFTSILAKYNRLEPVTVEKEKLETKPQTLLTAANEQDKGKGRSHDEEKSQSKYSSMTQHGKSKFGDSLRVRSRSGDSPRFEYGDRLKSNNTSFGTKIGDSPRSVLGVLPTMELDNSLKSEYEDSSVSKLGCASPRPEFGDLPRSKFDDSSKLQYGSPPKLDMEDLSCSGIHNVENDDFTKTEFVDLHELEVGDYLRSKLHAKQQIDSQTALNEETNSSLPSIAEIGSENIERFYLDHAKHDDNDVKTEIKNSTGKKHLSRKEKKKLHEAKSQQLPSSTSWDEMALHGTGKKK